MRSDSGESGSEVEEVEEGSGESSLLFRGMVNRFDRPLRSPFSSGFGGRLALGTSTGGGRGCVAFGLLGRPGFLPGLPTLFFAAFFFVLVSIVPPFFAVAALSYESAAFVGGDIDIFTFTFWAFINHAPSVSWVSKIVPNKATHARYKASSKGWLQGFFLAFPLRSHSFAR